MTDEAFSLTYVVFNFFEAVFWMILGIVAFIIAGTKYTGFRNISLFTTVTLINIWDI